MTKATDSTPTDIEEGCFHRAGQVLSAARQEQGISLERVSERLKISVSYLEALEACEYEQLPGPTFIRGYLRSYARLVKLDEEHILSLYGESVQADEQVARLLKEKPLDSIHVAPGGQGLVVFTILLVAGFVAASVFWWQGSSEQDASAELFNGQPVDTAFTRSESEPQRQPKARVFTEAGQSAEPVEENLEEKPVSESELSRAEELSSAEYSAPVVTVELSAVENVEKEPAGALVDAVQDVAEEAQSGGSLPVQGSVFIQFSGDCWIEVRDAADNILFSDLQARDSELALEGRVPLRITFGKVSSVDKVIFNGKPVNIDIPVSASGVGRLTLG